MFFDDIIMKNKVLARLWRAGNNQITETPEESSSMSTTWKTLELWVGSEDIDPRRRISLRTSAVLIDGAAKLYKKEVDQLFRDVTKLDEALFFRNRTKPVNSDDKEATDSSVPCDSSDEQMIETERHADKSIEKRTRSPIISIKRKSQTKRQSTETIGDPEDGTPKRRATSQRSDDQSSEQTESSDQNLAEVVSDHDQNIDGQSPKRHETSKRQTSDPTSEKSEIISKVRSSRPTCSDLFDFVASLPNYSIEGMDIDAAGSDIQDRTTTEEIVTEMNSDRDGRGSGPDEKSDGDKGIPDDETIVEEITDGNTGINSFGDRNEGDQEKEGSIILSSKMMLGRKKRKHDRNKKDSKQAKKKKEQASQTVPIHPNMSERDDNFNKDLPFGCLLIYDSYKSRIPSKVVFSSLTQDVNNIV